MDLLLREVKAREEVNDVGAGGREGEPPQLEDLRVLHLVLVLLVGPLRRRRRGAGAAGAAAVVLVVGGELGGDGVVVVLLLAAEDLHVAAAHVEPVSLERELGLDRGGEEHEGLAGEAAALVGQEAVDDVEAGEESVNVKVGAVEGEAPETDDGEGVGGGAARIAGEGCSIAAAGIGLVGGGADAAAAAAAAHCEVGIRFHHSWSL